MNKIILMGRLVREPETRYAQSAEAMVIVRYSLAVNKRFKRQGDTSDADFFNCVAFGRAGEFAGKYFHKGQKVAVVGRLSNNTWQDKTGVKRTATEIIVDEHYFCGEKSKADERLEQPATEEQAAEMFYPADEEYGDEDLPF